MVLNTGASDYPFWSNDFYIGGNCWCAPWWVLISLVMFYLLAHDDPTGQYEVIPLHLLVHSVLGPNVHLKFQRWKGKQFVPPFDVCDRTAQVSVLNVKVSCFPETMNESFPTFFGNVGEAMKCAATSLCCWLLRWNLRKVKYRSTLYRMWLGTGQLH